MRDKARIYEIRIISTIQILGINNQISFLHDNLRSDRNTPLYYSLYALNTKKKGGGGHTMSCCNLIEIQRD
jgi:hypothetical protein